MPGAPPRRRLPGPFLLIVITVLLLLHGLPWWRLVVAPQWPAAVTVAGTILAIVAMIGVPFAMIHGHGRRASDRWARIGDSWLGIIWVLFSWTVIGELAGLVLLLAGVSTPERQRVVAAAVFVVAIVLCSWGNYQARRVPPVRRTEITLDRIAIRNL